MKKLFYAIILLVFSNILQAQEISIEFYKSGFSDPLNLQNAGDERLFVVEQGGRIKIIQGDGMVNTTPYLDISGQISSGGERGLLGLAFHPDYQNNGYFYVNYTNPAGNTQVSRFSVDPSNPDLADPNSELPLLSYVQPFSNHNGGNLAFGPDGYLYISSGDGGSGGDPGNRAQNLLLLLGKLLRLDVDNPSGGNNYGIPADNPFVGNPDALDEIWAYGLRNPWRFSFDFTANNLWIGDVGQGNWEELDRQSTSAAGLNYGWRCYEGNHTFNTDNCPPMGDLSFPLAEYSHAGGNCSVTGGYVYRGSVYSDIAGLYLFADYCSGMIGSVDGAGNLVDFGNFSGNWVSFGEDVNKELYIIDISEGNIYKILGGVLANPNFTENTHFNLVPNPATSTVTLHAINERIAAYSVLDINGRILISENNNPSESKILNISGFSNGVYFVRATAESGEQMVKKLIKQ